MAGAIAAAGMVLVHRGLLSERTWNAASLLHPHTVACLLAGAVALAPRRTRRAQATPAIVVNYAGAPGVVHMASFLEPPRYAFRSASWHRPMFAATAAGRVRRLLAASRPGTRPKR